ITLTSHNASSCDLNAQRLESLPQRLRTFKAKIVGDFPETAYPTEETLEVKKGAQVMFVRNDLSPEKRYFNGKIGKVTRFAGDEMFVRCKDEREDIAVAPVEWQNIKYSIDERTKELKEETLVRGLFDFGAINNHLQGLRRLFQEHPGALSAEGLSQFNTLVAKTGAEVLSIAQKFAPQLQTYFSQPQLPDENESLRERLRKAGGYFSSKLNSEFLAEV